MSHFFDSNHGSFRWEMLKTIENEIFKVDGTIFGGYIMDTIIHNHYAEMFYKAKENAKEKEEEETELEPEPVEYFIDRNDPDKMDVVEEDEDKNTVPYYKFSYSNKNANPESWPHRTRQPDDIDFVIRPSKLDTFLFNMKKAGLGCSKLYCKNAMCYIPTVDVSNMRHIKYHVYLNIPANFSRFVHSPTISLDVIIDPKYEIGKTVIPYGEYDFECNRIILTKMGYNICSKNGMNPMHKIEEIRKIIDDILAFRAIPKNAVPYRMMRMLMKGFTVQTAAFTAFRGSTEPLDGRCLHCLEEFNFTDYTIKNNCCEARYHINCYPLTQKSGTECKYNNVDYCALCRSAIKKK